MALVKRKALSGCLMQAEAGTGLTPSLADLKLLSFRWCKRSFFFGHSLAEYADGTLIMKL